MAIEKINRSGSGECLTGSSGSGECMTKSVNRSESGETLVKQNPTCANPVCPADIPSMIANPLQTTNMTQKTVEGPKEPPKNPLQNPTAHAEHREVTKETLTTTGVCGCAQGNEEKCTGGNCSHHPTRAIPNPDPETLKEACGHAKNQLAAHVKARAAEYKKECAKDTIKDSDAPLTDRIKETGEYVKAAVGEQIYKGEEKWEAHRRKDLQGEVAQGCAKGVAHPVPVPLTATACAAANPASAAPPQAKLPGANGQGEKPPRPVGQSPNAGVPEQKSTTDPIVHRVAVHQEPGIPKDGLKPGDKYTEIHTTVKNPALHC